MTHVIRVQNVNEALPEGLWWLKTVGIQENSRNGPVIVAPGPVITEYASPWECVLFDAERDANPVFHLVEALWMLAGRDDVASLSTFNGNMVNYAEDDGRIWGAYGARWRRHFYPDQLLEVVEMLRNDPKTRRAVISMWSPDRDLGKQKRDLPCNTHVYFDTVGGRLNMTVCCRSNDAVWGAYGANAVHFAFLHMAVAAGAGMVVGRYRQFSNNFHAYLENPQVQRLINRVPPAFTEINPYLGNPELAQPIITGDEDLIDFLKDCEDFFGPAPLTWRTRFVREIAHPLRVAYLKRKAGKPYPLYHIPDCDWKHAFVQWAARRSNKEKA